MFKASGHVGLRFTGRARVLTAQGEDPVFVERDHVAVIGPVVHLDEADGLFDLVGRLGERPPTILRPIGDLDHGCAIQAMMTVKENRLVLGIGQH